MDHKKHGIGVGTLRLVEKILIAASVGSLGFLLQIASSNFCELVCSSDPRMIGPLMISHVLGIVIWVLSASAIGIAVLLHRKEKL